MNQKEAHTFYRDFVKEKMSKEWPGGGRVLALCIVYTLDNKGELTVKMAFVAFVERIPSTIPEI